MRKLTEKEKTDLWLRLRKENVEFDDLCEARDSVVRVMEGHSISLDALKVEVQRYDQQLAKKFEKVISIKTKFLDS